MVALEMTDGSFLTHEDATGPPQSLPRKLEFSDSISLIFYASELVRRVNELGHKAYFVRAVAIDAEDREYSSKLPKSLIF